jgi:peptidoglycan/LPS O-acetylase OafA/YrhL
VYKRGMRDDHLFRGTRALAIVIVPFLLLAFAALYFFPDDTDAYFAWDVQPTLTPLIMGAGYVAGAYFFLRVARETRWHRVHVGFLPVTAFTLFMAIGTFNHLDRFATGHVAFWIWVGLYVTTPVLVPLAWWRNRATDPGTPEPGEPALPRGAREALLAVGGLQSAVALVLLLSPSTMIDAWPWTLTPLTAQTLGGWFALPGVTALMMGLDGRWSAIRITLESQLIGLGLILLGTARAWEDVDTTNPLAYAFVAGLAALFLALAALEWHMLATRRVPACA